MKAGTRGLERKKRELHEKLHQIWSVITTAKECLLFSKDLRFSEDQKVNHFLRKSRHFTFIHTVLWKQCAIELTKLFSENERTHKFNIHRLIRQLEQGEHFGVLKYSKVSIRNWKDQLDKNSSQLHLVEDLRNKAYAHTDPNFDLSTLDVPTYNEIENLIAFAEEIIREIGSVVFSEYIETNHLPHYDKRFPLVLSDLVEFRDQRTKTWFQEERKKWASS